MHRRVSAAIFVAALAALAVPEAGLAKLYKWVDEDGNVTYSERKPPDVEAETLEIRTGGPSEEQAQESLDRLREEAQSGEKDREFEATAAAQKQERAQRLKKNCEIARQNMRVLQNSSRIQAENESGEPYFLDESQIQQRMEATAQQIEDYCQ